MDDRGSICYLGHCPGSKELTEGSKWFPTLFEISQRDWTQIGRSGPFAHLTEALNEMYHGEINVLMRKRSQDIDFENNRCSESEKDTLGTMDAKTLSRNSDLKDTSLDSWAREYKPESGDIRGLPKWEKLAPGRRKIETKVFHRSCRDREAASQGIGNGIHASAPHCKGGPDVKSSSCVANAAISERSLQIKLKKPVLPHVMIKALSYTRKEANQPPVQRQEQRDDGWDYDFCQDSLPSIHRYSVDASSESKSVCFEVNRSAGSVNPIRLTAQKLSLKTIPISSSEPTVRLRLETSKKGDRENERAFKQWKHNMMENLKSGQLQRGQIIKQLLCGGFAGVISRTAVAPLDLIKTHLITSHGLLGPQKSALSICSDIVKQSGWQGLFRGNFVNCIRVAPNKAIELFVFETVRRALNKEDNPLKNLAATIAGGAAGMAGTITTYPLELVRTRLYVQPKLYIGPVRAMSKIFKEEGFLAFYSGLSPSLVGVFPYAATNYFVYDGLRSTYCRTTGRPNVPTIPTLIFGAVSAATSSTVTYPLEVARRQMQLALADGVAKRSTVHIIKDIYRNEGFLALYRGLGTTWLKLIPAAGISFMCYEAARLALCIDDASIVKPEEASAMEVQELDS